MDNKGLRTKLTTLLAKHDSLLASQKEAKQEIEALEIKKKNQDQIIKESHKTVIEKDAQIEKLGEEITWFEKNIDDCEETKESIDKEIEDYKKLSQEDAKQLEKVLKKIQKFIK